MTDSTSDCEINPQPSISCAGSDPTAAMLRSRATSSTCLTVPPSLMSRNVNARQLHPPVACPPFDGSVGFLRPARSETLRREPIRRDLVPCDERLAHRSRPRLRELLVIGDSAHAVGMALDRELPFGMPGHGVGYLLQHRLG